MLTLIREAYFDVDNGPMVDEVTESDFQDEWDRRYLQSVRRATQRTFDLAAWRSPQEVYGVLAEELRRRRIDPEPDAVFEGAMLISRGIRPAVLHTN